ncbi:MAG: GNAT family N-acetyltransferase [Henriciella sp.]|nr:GNAT family N-acetyltransferase [Henriciella sp.]
MRIDIRPLTAADRDIWAELWTGYLTFYESTVAPAVYDTTFQRLLEDGSYEPSCLLAWEGEEAVGLVHYLFHRHCWRQENVCYLQDLFASETARGKGVGRALIEAVYVVADRENCPTVYWTTAEDNHIARQLYDRIAQKTPFIKYQR